MAGGMAGPRDTPGRDGTRRPVTGSRTGANALRPILHGSRTPLEVDGVLKGEIDGGRDGGDSAVSPTLAAAPGDMSPKESSSSERSCMYEGRDDSECNSECGIGEVSESSD